MPTQKLDVAANNYDLTVGGNITTGDVGIADSVTTGAVSVGAGLTSGTVAIGAGGAGRTGAITIGNVLDTGVINLRTTGDVNLGAAGGSSVKVLDTTAASSTSTGALIVSGGVGVTGRLHCSDKIFLQNGLETGSASSNVGLYNNVTTGNVTVGANLSTGNLTLHKTSQIGNIICNTDVEMERSLTFNNKGAVTQLTSETTGVTLNAPVSIITSFAGTLVATTLYSYTFTNSFITASSVILLTVQGQDTAGPNTSLIVHTDAITAGSCTIWVTNPWASNWTGAYKLHFIIL